MRREGIIPAVIYGKKVEPVHIALTERDLKVYFDSHEHVIDLDVDGKSQKVIIKEVQNEPVKGLPLHIDFLNVENNVEFTTYVPVHLLNAEKAHGVKMGGQLRRNLHKLKIRTTLENLPEHVDIDIIDLDTQKSFLVRHLEGKAYSIITPESEAICSITKARSK
jgi:large subunit ribosomal protein L25